MKTTCLIALLASSLALAACGGGAPRAATPNAPAGALVKPGDAKLGDRTTCPVSGEEFVVSADSPKAEYNGKTYYFCCPGCDKKFSAEPEKFIGQK